MRGQAPPGTCSVVTGRVAGWLHTDIKEREGWCLSRGSHQLNSHLAQVLCAPPAPCRRGVVGSLVI